MTSLPRPARRRLLRAATASAAALCLPGVAPAAQASAANTRAIPSSGEALPVVGLGSWITFNVGNDAGRARRLRRR